MLYFYLMERVIKRFRQIFSKQTFNGRPNESQDNKKRMKIAGIGGMSATFGGAVYGIFHASEIGLGTGLAIQLAPAILGLLEFRRQLRLERSKSQKNNP